MNLVLIGKPGCGKGSFCNYLLNNYSKEYIQLSTGDLMKKIMKQDNDTSAWLKSLLNQGNFAPDDFTIKLIKQEIESINNINGNINIIYDGFPRTLEQAKILEKEIDIDLVIYFDIDDKVIKDRIVNRLIHLPSGRIYNEKTNPPKNPGFDDVTGEPLVKRDDDNLSIIDKRLNNFNELTMPAFNHLKENNNFIVVDGNLNPQQIFEQVQFYLNSNKKQIKKRI